MIVLLELKIVVILRVLIKTKLIHKLLKTAIK